MGEAAARLASDDPALQALAAPIHAKGKASPADLRAVIRRLCAGRFLTGEALAKLLRRNQAYLRGAILTPMVTEGLLRLRHPETPNRPDQAYTATSDR